MADRAAHVDDELGIKLRPFKPTEIRHGVANVVEVFAHHAKGKNIEPVVIHGSRLSAVSRPALVVTRHQVNIHRPGVVWHRDGLVEFE